MKMSWGLVLGVGSIGLLIKVPSFSGTRAIPIPTGDTSPIIVIVLALMYLKLKPYLISNDYYLIIVYLRQLH